MHFLYTFLTSTMPPEVVVEEASKGTWGPLAIVVAAAVTLITSGSVLALLKGFASYLLASRKQRLSEGATLDARVGSLLELQKKEVLEPLTERVKNLEGKVERVEKELVLSRSLYAKSIGYVRELFVWIEATLPHRRSEIPSPPEEIVEDL